MHTTPTHINQTGAMSVKADNSNTPSHHEEYMKTPIIIDDALMAEALSVSGIKTKKEAIEEALKLLISMKRQSEIRKRGRLQWKDDLETMKTDPE